MMHLYYHLIEFDLVLISVKSLISVQVRSVSYLQFRFGLFPSFQFRRNGGVSSIRMSAPRTMDALE